MKELKLSPVAPAMMMFGGSPIRVAVPPMFDAITSMISSGIGSMSSASASRKVIGVISRIVVRLSRKAESTAVVAARLIVTANERPPLRDRAGRGAVPAQRVLLRVGAERQADGPEQLGMGRHIASTGWV